MSSDKKIVGFKKEERAALNKLYASCGVENGTTKDKLKALNGELGPSHFHAYGGGETLEMELSALEAVYLLEEGFNI